MRKLFGMGILAVIGILLFLIGCAGTSVVAPEVVTHHLAVTVESTNDREVTVVQDDGIYTADQREGMGLGKLSQLSWVNDAQDKAFVKIFSGLSVADVTRLWNDLNWLGENSAIREIDLFINSPGGDAFSGLALADQIERAKRAGFTIHAHASGIIASAAVPVFAVCSTRNAAPGTIFMVHEAALWKWPGRETASDIRAQNELMVLLRDRYIDYLVKNSKTNKETWEHMEGRTSWFNAAAAIDLGLVDNIE